MKLLVVDNSPTCLEAFEIILHHAGHHLTLVTSGEDALKRLRGDHFDAMITDIVMPGLSGEDLIMAIRLDSSLADLPILAVTAVTSLLLLERLEAVGVKVLWKPIQRRQLLGALAAMALPA